MFNPSNFLGALQFQREGRGEACFYGFCLYLMVSGKNHAEIMFSS